jgi:hypothetical protein
MRALEILGQEVQILHRGRDLAVTEDDREIDHIPPFRRYWVAKVWRSRWNPERGRPRHFRRQ